MADINKGLMGHLHDLRIGNVIRFRNKHVIGHKKILSLDGSIPPKEKDIWRHGKIYSITLDRLSVIDENKHFHDLINAEPVELTYEILGECGFKKSEGHYYKGLMEKLYLVYAIDKNLPALCLGKGAIGKWNLEPLKHSVLTLHRLMNIYYDLASSQLIWNKFKPSVTELYESTRRPPIKV